MIIQSLYNSIQELFFTESRTYIIPNMKSAVSCMTKKMLQKNTEALYNKTNESVFLVLSNQKHAGRKPTKKS